MDIFAISVLVLFGTVFYALSMPQHFAKIDVLNPLARWQNHALKLLSLLSHACALAIYRIENPWVDTLLVFAIAFAVCAPAIIAFFSGLPHRPLASNQVDIETLQKLQH